MLSCEVSAKELVCCAVVAINKGNEPTLAGWTTDEKLPANGAAGPTVIGGLINSVSYTTVTVVVVGA